MQEQAFVNYKKNAYELGVERLRSMELVETPSILEEMADVAPDLAKFIISFVYGEIYERPHLTSRIRQLATVAIFATLGNARRQLKFHLTSALNIGCSPAELIEVMIQLALYAGFPVALNGVFAAKEVFDEKQLDFISSCGSPLVCEDRYESGLKALEHIDGPDGQMIIKTLGSIAPDLARFVVEFGFGDIYTRPILNFFEREIITVAALGTLGTAIPQLKLHIQGLLNVGGTPEQVIELAIHIAPYAGFPAAINVVEIAKEVFASRKET